MNLLGVELNASCARAVQGPLGDYALTVPLDPPHPASPLILSLEKNPPEIGRAGLKNLRQKPYLTCSDFLPTLGTQGPQAKRWKVGRQLIDSDQALGFVWKKIAQLCPGTSGGVLSLPGYLSHHQADLARDLGSKHKILVLGSLPSLLAAALAGYGEQNWIGSSLVLDIDEHALSLGHVRAVDGQAHLLDARYFPKLGLKIWQDRLINAVADSCVLQTRRDPRDVPEAEQSLFEQLDALLDAGLHGRMIQLGIQAPHWYQNILLQPEQTQAFCLNLTRQVLQEIEAFFHGLPVEETPATILVTAPVGRLPGLVARLRAFMEAAVQEPQESATRPATLLEDFGDELIQDSSGQIASVVLLAPEAAARAAHGLGPYFQRGDLPRGHLERVAPLPLPQPLEAGPARLHFQGQDYFLREPNFTLGSQIGCHLLFDHQRYPGVAPRHCEILFDHRTFVLFNRSREGTLLNDASVNGSVVLHPGDWIRLGPQGPLVRFLGHAPGRHLTA